VNRDDPITSLLATASVLRPCRASGYPTTQPRAAHYGFAGSLLPLGCYVAPLRSNDGDRFTERARELNGLRAHGGMVIVS